MGSFRIIKPESVGFLLLKYPAKTDTTIMPMESDLHAVRAHSNGRVNSDASAGQEAYSSLDQERQSGPGHSSSEPSALTAIPFSSLQDASISDLSRRTPAGNIVNALQDSGCGGLVVAGDDTSNAELMYFCVPPTSQLVHITPGTILLSKTKLLRSLCEMANNCAGDSSKWTCQSKDIGRLVAQCQHSGFPKKTRGRGLRIRVSKKVGCTACVSTVPFHSFFPKKKGQDLLVRIRALQQNIGKESGTVEDLSIDELTVVKTISLQHTGHDVRYVPQVGRTLSRLCDVFENEDIIQALKCFRRVCPGGGGSVLKAGRYLTERFPHVNIPYDTLRNVIARLCSNEEDAFSMINYLRDARKRGEVEYLFYDVDEASRVLRSVTWSYKGSECISRRYNDVLFWDSTHNTTSYDYKFSTFTLVDSEGSSRAVLLSFNLQETVESCKKMLACWHQAFGRRLPQVIFTDGDEAMSLAIASVPYSEDLKHLLCTYHLFDMNVKQKLKPIITGTGGIAAWSSFRKALSICREATTEFELSRLWKDLLQEWMPLGEKHKSGRFYLQRFVWGKRKQWAVAYFSDCLTLGAMSTQRSESWNSLLRCFADSTDLANYVRSVHSLIERQGMKEEKSRSLEYRVGPLINAPKFAQKQIMEQFGRCGISRYACEEVTHELNEAEALGFRVEDQNNEYNEERQISHVGIHGSAYRVYNDAGCLQIFESSGETRVDISFNIPALGDGTEGPLEFSFRCECLYFVRMGLPCRHGLAACLQMDRTIPELREVLSEVGYGSMLCLICHHTVSERWLLHADSFSHVLDAGIRDCVRERLETHFLLLEESEVREWMRQCGINTKVGQEIDARIDGRVQTFPDVVACNGDSHAFSLIRSLYTQIAENVTKCDSGLTYAALIYEVGLVFERDTRDIASLQQKHSTGQPEIWLRNVLDSNFECVKPPSRGWKRTAPNRAKGTVSVSSKSERRSGESNRLYVTASPTSDAIPIARMCGAEEIRNPKRRHDARKSNRNAVVTRKTRALRQLRRDLSRKAPPAFRNDKQSAKIPAKPEASGYACPLCTNISVQSNAENVRQHFVHKHMEDGKKCLWYRQ